MQLISLVLILFLTEPLQTQKHCSRHASNFKQRLKFANKNAAPATVLYWTPSFVTDLSHSHHGVLFPPLCHTSAKGVLVPPDIEGSAPEQHKGESPCLGPGDKTCHAFAKGVLLPLVIIASASHPEAQVSPSLGFGHRVCDATATDVLNPPVTMSFARHPNMQLSPHIWLHFEICCAPATGVSLTFVVSASAPPLLTQFSASSGLQTQVFITSISEPDSGLAHGLGLLNMEGRIVGKIFGAST